MTEWTRSANPRVRRITFEWDQAERVALTLLGVRASVLLLVDDCRPAHSRKSPEEL